jgi:hypothetical protein
MIKPEQLNDLRAHLQTAIEVEMSTIPLYLYTYYSIKRTPKLHGLRREKRNPVATYANKAGGFLMSVAIEEMLHLALVSNILKALGGTPKIYGRSPQSYPTNLSHHKKGFSIGLTRLSANQLTQFMAVEQPAPVEHEPQGDNWETLGQFYEYVISLIELTEDGDYNDPDFQLADGKGYYASSNIDTIYPENSWDKRARNAQFPNSDDSGGLMSVTNKKEALAAIIEITEQGEGFKEDPTHQYDDKDKKEESHWYKYKELHDELIAMDLGPSEMEVMLYNFADNPKKSDYPSDIRPMIDLVNATYSYLLWMTEISFTLKGSAQNSMFYIGMHKAMIFVLDKVIGAMRTKTYTGPDGKKYNVSPTFENFEFEDITTAKKTLIQQCELVLSSKGVKMDSNILKRINDLPDINVVNGIVCFS